ncbi:IS21 family transposase [Sediminibacterium sp. WSJ-3]|nr:IS21 family transposase [Sediminibacterium soli]
MSNKTIEMFTIRQILRLYASGKGTKFISQSTGIARNTVKKYLYRYVLSEKTIEQIESMSDAEMSRLFLIKEPIVVVNKRLSDLESLLPSLASMLKKRGVTKGMVYEHYKLQHPDGYMSSSFLEKLNGFMQVGKPSMKMTHKAGDKMFVDFTGQKLQLVDKVTGEISELEVFVAILGCSQLTFVMAVHSQCKEDFILGCERALHFFGGVPQAIVPDNLKSAVTKASKYEAQLNDSFAAFAEHYQTFGFPTRTYKPKDKALVEGAVKIIYTTIFSKIDQNVYHELDQINKDILIHLEAHNNANLTGESYSRMRQFIELEKQLLQPLNPYLFEPMTTQLSTVNKYGHVLLSVDKRYYSVPYKLIGKRLKIKYTTTRLEIYDGNEVVAAHDRFLGKGLKYITVQDHLASQHKYLAEWNPQKFMATASSIGEAVAQYIARILARELYPEQSYKSCSGVLSFAKRVGNARLINACERADSFGIYNYGIIDQILRSKADTIPFEDEIPNPEMPSHENIRGQDYYE